MSAKQTSLRVLAAVAAGVALAVAVANVAVEEGRTGSEVLGSSRTTRYLVYNEHRLHPLCENPPDDVVCVAYRWDAEGEASRQRLLGDMGAHVSTLPAMLVWVGEGNITVPDGGVIVTPPGWRSIRTPEAWNDTPAPASRDPENAREWALSRNPPPEVSQ